VSSSKNWGSTTDYTDAIAYLDGHAGRGVKPGLERISGMLDIMAEPQRGYPVIHIAGTNGKTSTARMAAEILREHGLNPGLFTSPHLQTVEERFEVSGEMMTREEFGAAVEDLQPIVDLFEARSGDGVTYFELTTALAFAWFAERAVDVAVVETGLGGRLDSTNVVEAAVAVVTTIGLEHTAFLGDSLEAIAAEKMAILDDGRALVTGDLPAEALEAARRRVEETGSSWLRFGEDFRLRSAQAADGGWRVDLEGVYHDYEGVLLRLHGRHQTVNWADAVASVEALFGRKLASDAVVAAASKVTLPGRMEVIGGDPVVMLDGAHNPAGMAALAAALGEEYPAQRWSLVFGVMVDKDVTEMLQLLAPHVDRLYAAAAADGRARSAEEVAAVAAEMGIREAVACSSVAQAVAAARDGGGPVLVTGSLYVVGEARTAISLG
jgi:dihydrofolate synthase/folylpolyglutamate synthase